MPENLCHISVAWHMQTPPNQPNNPAKNVKNNKAKPIPGKSNTVTSLQRKFFRFWPQIESKSPPILRGGFSRWTKIHLRQNRAREKGNENLRFHKKRRNEPNFTYTRSRHPNTPHTLAGNGQIGFVSSWKSVFS